MDHQHRYSRYLAPSSIIDWSHPSVLRKALSLSHGSSDDIVVTRRCFFFVRDEVLHSADHQRNPVTLRASEVLEHGTGLCYAKSHLLAALLRANGIPAGLCYQRLSSGGGRFCLHGLNAVHLSSHGWYRIDARGNNEKVHAEFDPPRELLAFAPAKEGEADLPEVWEEPLPAVVRAFSGRVDLMEVLDGLPDIELVRV